MNRWLAFCVGLLLCLPALAQNTNTPPSFPYTGVGNVLAVTVNNSDTVGLQRRDSFTGAISGTILTVSAIAARSALQLGQPVYGTGVAAGTIITKFGDNTTGGVGTDTVNNSQSVGSRAMASQGEPWVYLELDLQHSTAVVRCAFGARALAADTAGQITLNGAYATKIFSSFVPNDTLHCISSVTTTPLTVIAR